jgi:hypothetical protein
MRAGYNSRLTTARPTAAGSWGTAYRDRTTTSGCSLAKVARSSASPVSTTAPPTRTASATTRASTVALLFARPRSAPAVLARSSVAGETLPTALSTRFTGASRPPWPRTVSATTTEGTITSARPSHAAVRTARARASLRARAITAPESRIRRCAGGRLVRRLAIPAGPRPGRPREWVRTPPPSRPEGRRGGRAAADGEPPRSRTRTARADPLAPAPQRARPRPC